MRRHAWLPTFPCFVWIFFTLVVCFVMTSLSAIVSRDGDPALHVKLGQLMLERGGLLPVEPTCFGAPPDKPFIAHEWLAQILFALAYGWLGLAGPALLATFVYASSLALLTWWLVRTRTAPPWVVAAVILAAVFLGTRLIARPHIFTWLGSLGWLLALEHWRRGRLNAWRLAALGVPLIVLWANLHGGFLLAFALLGLYALGDAVDRSRDLARTRGGPLTLLGIGGAMAAASLLNPFGWHLHAHLISFLLHPVLGQAAKEFQPLDFTGLQGGLFLLHAGVGLGVLVRRGRKVSAAHVLLWLVLFGLGLRAGRHTALFVLLVPAALWAGPWRKRRPDASLDGRLLAAVVLIVTVSLVGLLRVPAVAFDAARMPVRALAHVRAHPERFAGRVYCEYTWGGYLALELYPPTQVFIHGLNDHYGSEHIEAFLQVRNAASGWEQILASSGVRWALVRPERPIAAALRAHEDWTEAYADDTSLLFVRSGP